MRKSMFWVAMLLAGVVGVFGALGTGANTASAKIPGDVCRMIAWDSTGGRLSDGATVKGNGDVFLVFRVEDDPFGYVNDFVLEGPVLEVIEELENEIDDLYDELAELGEGDENEIDEIEAEIFALEEVLLEYREAINSVLDTDLVQIDSSTGSARITSKMEVVGFEWVKPNIHHLLVQPGVGSQRVDHVFPNFFNDADGHDEDNIRNWLTSVGVIADTGPQADFNPNVCGSSTDDGWGFVDIKCIQPGRFRVNVIPQRGTTENTTGVIDLYCPGHADTATISASPATVESVPAPGPNVSSSIITVTVLDQAGMRHDGAQVTFTTDKCKFSNPGAGATGDSGMSPAGGGTTVTVWSDSDSNPDKNFKDNNPLQIAAGTAEVSLDCANVAPGTANITAIVERMGADIVLSTQVQVVGQASATGLTLVLTPDDIECGETILASVKAVDALGQNVSNGTVIYFTTDTTSGVLGGAEGAQGQAQTVNGEASVLIATDPSKSGVHTVIAYTINAVGTVNAQTSDTYVCDGAVAPAAPTVAPPHNGTGSITPPNTGSAGLAGSQGSSLWLVAGVALVAVLSTGLGLVAVRNR